MRWFALVLVLLAGRAAAGPCGNDTAFPQTSSTDVPVKTFVWLRSGIPGPYELTSSDSRRQLDAVPFQNSPLMLLAPGLLDPDTVYTLRANGVAMTTFTTAREAKADAQLPAPPVVGHLHITNGVVDMPVSSPGAVMLHVSLHRDQPDGKQLAEVWISRSGLAAVDLAACTGVSVKIGDTLCFWVSSVAANGQESAVTGRCAVDNPRSKKGPIDDTRAWRTPGDSWPVAPMLLVIAVVLALLYVGWRGGRERLHFKCCEPQPIDAVTVAWLARRQLLRRLIAAGVIAAGAYFVVPFAAFAVIVVADVWRLVVVAREAADGAPTTSDPRRGRAYVGNDGRSWISVGPFDLERAAAARLPRARATRL